MADIEDIAETRAPAGAHPAALAYAEVASEIAAVPEDELIPIKTDVINAVTTVLGSLPELRALRSEFADALRRFDLERFDKLESYARALHHAHVLWRAAAVPKADVAGLANELNGARDALSKIADGLAAFGLIDGQRLKGIKAQPGYRPIAMDVATIVEVLRERWSVVQNKAPLTWADLDRYASKALDLLAAIGLKEQAPATIGEAALNRNRAFTLFSRAYDEARRAVLYLRPKEGDEIAPSLYLGRGGRGSSSGPPPKEAPDSERPSEAPAAVPVAAMHFNNPTALPATPPFTS